MEQNSGSDIWTSDKVSQLTWMVEMLWEIYFSIISCNCDIKTYHTWPYFYIDIL